MSELGVRLASVFCLVVFLSRQSSADFWILSSQLTTQLPSGPNDPYYKTFQNVTPASTTAAKLMTNFLHISAGNLDRHKRQLSNSRDVVFVMDGSGSFGDCEFGKGKRAIKYMMGVAKEKGIDGKYAAVTFATSAKINFKFLPYATAGNKIMNISYPGGMTNTQAGLVEAKKLFNDPLSAYRCEPLTDFGFNPIITRGKRSAEEHIMVSRAKFQKKRFTHSTIYYPLSKGGRSAAVKMVFLLTDGQSTIQESLTILKAQALKNSGVLIYVVAVGTYINGIDEMVKVASYPPQQYLFRVKMVNSFWQIVKMITQQVSPSNLYAAIKGQYDPPC